MATYRVEGDEVREVFDLLALSRQMDAPQGFLDSLGRLASILSAGIDRDSFRSEMSTLGSEMLKMKTYEPELDHIFTEGLYARKHSSPAGSFMVTMVHKESNVSAITKGKMAIIDENGLKIVEAPQFFVSPAGMQRIIYCFTDMTFCTVHPNPTNERDVAKLEKRLSTLNYDEIETVAEYSGVIQ